MSIKGLIDEGVFTKKEIQTMRKKNPKGCISIDSQSSPIVTIAIDNY